MAELPIQDHTHSFQHALNGINFTLKNHSNLRVHLFIGLIIIVLGMFVGLKTLEWTIIVFTICLVVICEMVNTSLESLGDAITIKYSQEIKVAKDVSAGMVLVSSICAAFIGLVIFIPYIFNLVS